MSAPVPAFIIFCFAMMLISFAGCQTAPHKSAGAESPQEIVSALNSMTEGLTNKHISKEDLERLAQQVNKDPQVKSAVSALNSSFNIKDTGVKYCPTDGKRYSSRLEFCPDHQTKLLPVE